MSATSPQRNYKKINSQLLYSHPRIQLIEDEIILPDNSKSTYLLYGDLHDGSSVIVVREDGKLLLNYEYSYPADAYEYQFLGGAVDAGETPEAAAAREMKEEAGIVAGHIEQIGSMLYDHRRSQARNYFFVASDIAMQQHEQEASELIEQQWFSEAEVNKMVLTGAISHAGSLAAWAYYLARIYDK